MQQVKFCTAWNLSRLAYVVLLQTEEQENNLLKSRTFIIIDNQGMFIKNMLINHKATTLSHCEEWGLFVTSTQIMCW